MAATHRTRRSGLKGSSRACFEPLELRRLLCGLHVATQPIAELRPDLVGVEPGVTESPDAADIVWTNRGSDGFGTVFGANAEVARGIVDAVIFEYEQMITSFNYADFSTNFNLTVNMGSTGLGGGAQPLTSIGGKPKSGTMTLLSGSNGQGAGYFIDSTPLNHQEFMGTITNVYAGDAQAGSPAAGLVDLYTVVAAEMAHTLGLFTDPVALPGWSARTSNTGIPDTAEGGGVGTFWIFDGPSIKHLTTSNNGGPAGQSMSGAVHTAGVATIDFNNITWIGAEDAGNAVMEPGRRYLVPDTLGLMFKDAYNYTVVTSGRYNFYAVWNPADGKLLIRGRDVIANTFNSFALKRNGSNIEVSVDPISDVGGTGAQPGEGNFPPFTTLHNPALISNIVIEGSANDDAVTIDYVNGSITNVSPDNIIINGGGSADMLIVLGGSSPESFLAAADSIEVLSDNISYSNMELIEIDGGGGNDWTFVYSTAPVAPMRLYGSTGEDTVQLMDPSANFQAPVFFDGGGEAGDRLIFYDVNSPGGSVVTVSPTQVTKNGGFFGANYSNIGRISIFDGTSSTNPTEFHVNDTAPGVLVEIDGGNIPDGYGINETAPNSLVSIFNSAGGDIISVNGDGVGTAVARQATPVSSPYILVVGTGGKLEVGPSSGKVLKPISFSFAPAASIDLYDNTLILDYTNPPPSPIDTVAALLTSGYANGSWNGLGIRSSTAALTPGRALGFAEASDIFSTFPATFAGQSIDSTTVLVRHTLYGDANLDGNVNLNDFNRLAANFGQSNRRWSQGDFDFNNTANLTDFNALAANFGQSGSAPDGLRESLGIGLADLKGIPDELELLD